MSQDGARDNEHGDPPPAHTHADVPTPGIFPVVPSTSQTGLVVTGGRAADVAPAPESPSVPPSIESELGLIRARILGGRPSQVADVRELIVRAEHHQRDTQNSASLFGLCAWVAGWELHQLREAAKSVGGAWGREEADPRMFFAVWGKHLLQLHQGLQAHSREQRPGDAGSRRSRRVDRSCSLQHVAGIPEAGEMEPPLDPRARGPQERARQAYGTCGVAAIGDHRRPSGSRTARGRRRCRGKRPQRRDMRAFAFSAWFSFAACQRLPRRARRCRSAPCDHGR